MARGELILPDHLPKRVQKAAMRSGVEHEEAATGTRMEDVERTAILRTLRENRFNRSETARALGISRRALLYKLQRFRQQGYTVEAD